MKKLLLATSALVASAGFASAQGGVTLSGTASMGVLGGGWIVDTDDEHRGAGRQGECRSVDIRGCPIPGQSEYELHTDIDVTFTMSGQTDTGLTFGASIDLDESDGHRSRGASNAFDNREQGGEEIFISGAFGTLTMGDTDGALDWALQEIDIGGSIGDAHTVHAGYNGNDFADGARDFAGGDGQIVRYEYSFGDFGMAFSADISDDASYEDVLAVGAKYNASLAAMELGLGVGYTLLGGDTSFDDREDNDAIGFSLDANFNNGFRVILNWADMGDSNLADGGDSIAEKYVGVGLGYVLNDWTVSANWGEYSEDIPNTDEDRGQRGYAFVVNYDLGGGAQVQFGYSKSRCATETVNGNPSVFAVFLGDAACETDHFENSAASLGIAMSF